MTEPIPVAPTGASPQNRLPLILGVAVAAVLILFVGYKLVSGGGGSSSSTATTSAVSPGVRSSSRSTTTTSTTALDESFQDFRTKNPFQPLQSAIGAAPATSSGSTTGGTSTAGTSTGGTTVASGGGGASGPAAATQPRTSQRVALLDVFTEGSQAMANVKVNDTVYKVASGGTFASSYKAVSISASSGCGQFLFGDEPFRLCKGQEVLK
jgi:hypothetical protein